MKATTQGTSRTCRALSWTLIFVGRMIYNSIIDIANLWQQELLQRTAMVYLEMKHYSVVNSSLIAGLGKDLMRYYYNVLSKFLTYLEGLILTRQSVF